MMMRIRIRWGQGEVIGVLDDTPTSRKVYEVLPCTSGAHTWGEEVYFRMPVKAKLDPNPKQVVESGTICFWVQGSSLAVPYGPTPISERNECRLVTAVNVLGKLEGDPKTLASVRDGDEITVERVE